MVALSVLSFAALASCAPIAGRTAGKATKGTIEQLGEPQTRETFAEFLSDPQVQEATQDFTRGVAGAVADEVIEEERAEALTQGIVRSIAEGIEQDIGPAVRETIRTDVSRGIVEGLDEDVNEALGRTARTISREVVLGSREALAQIREEQPRGGVLGRAERTAKIGLGVFQLIAIVLGITTLVLFALFLRSLFRERRARKVAEGREAALLLLASVIKVAEGRPWAGELRDLLREEMRDQPGAEYIRDLLREHPSLRIRMPPETEKGRPTPEPPRGPPHPSPA